MDQWSILSTTLATLQMRCYNVGQQGSLSPQILELTTPNNQQEQQGPRWKTPQFNENRSEDTYILHNPNDIDTASTQKETNFTQISFSLNPEKCGGESPSHHFHHM